MFSGTAYAMAPPPGSEPSGFDMVMSFAPLIILVFIFYFLIIRPQNKKQQETKEMIGNLKEGDNIMTSGGLMGTITKVKDDIITLKVAEDVKVKINKTYVASLK